MSKATTNTDKSVKVVTDVREKELLSIFHTLHGKVMTALQEVGVAPKFNDKFEKCNNEDYKSLHEQARILLRDKSRARWESYIGSINTEIQGVIGSYMNKARATKAHLDTLRANTPEDMRGFLPAFPNTVKVPVSDLVGCFPQGKGIEQIVAELDKLFPRQVGKGKEDVFFLTVAFQAEEKKEEPKAEESAQAPTSTEASATEAAEEPKDLATAAE